MPGPLVVASFAGAPNFGDDHMHALWLQFYRETFPDARIRSELAHSAFTAPHAAASNAGVGGWLFEAAKLIWGERVRSQKIDNDWTEGLLRQHLPDMVAAYDALFADTAAPGLLHVVGGGFINRFWPHSYALLDLASWLRGRYGCRIVFTGQGLEPALAPALERSQHGASPFIDIFDLRDEASSDVARRTVAARSISQTGDDALLGLGAMGGEMRGVQFQATPTIALAVQTRKFFDLEADGNAAVLAEAVRVAAEVLGAKRLVFLKAMRSDLSPDHSADTPDNPLHRMLSQFQDVETISPKSLLTEGFPVFLHGLLFTTRYHPHLLAAAAGGRGMFIAQSSYYAVKHAAVTAMGSRFPTLALDEDDATRRRAIENAIGNSSQNLVLLSNAVRAKRQLLDSLVGLVTGKALPNICAAAA